MKMWSKLDEVLGAGMLTGVAVYALHLTADLSIVMACVTGIVALLAVQAAKNHESHTE